MYLTKARDVHVEFFKMSSLALILKLNLHLLSKPWSSAFATSSLNSVSTFVSLKTWCTGYPLTTSINTVSKKFDPTIYKYIIALFGKYCN